VSPEDGIRLEVGDRGPATSDVQQRLEQLGFSSGIDPVGTFGAGTRAAVEAFQYRRGLRVDGICGNQTWSALVEAGRRLGSSG
jgi:peptidoglycan hydrolase-like protein with peptidoglycan-binding domain